MNEDYSEEFLNEMRLELERQQAELIDESKVIREEMRDRDHEPGDSIDESVDEQDTSTELRLKDRERNLLVKISEALGRLEDGDYGYCLNCAEPIGEKRLKVRPMADLCIDCKEIEEREERRLKTGNPGIFSPIKHG